MIRSVVVLAVLSVMTPFAAAQTSPRQQAVCAGIDAAGLVAAAEDPFSGPVLTHGAFVIGTDMSEDKRFLLTTDRDGISHLWDVATHRVLHRFDHGDAPLTDSHYAAKFLTDPNRIATRGPSSLKIWDRVTGALISKLTFPENEDRVLLPSDDGHMVIESVYKQAEDSFTARLRRADDGAIIAVLDHPGIDAAQFIDTNQRLLTLSDDQGRLWDTRSGQQVAAFPRIKDAPVTVYNAETNRLFESPDDRRVQIRDAASGHTVGPVFTPPDAEFTLEQFYVSDDGRALITVSELQTEQGYAARMQMWDVATGRPVGQQRTLPAVMPFPVFIPDTHLVVMRMIPTNVQYGTGGHILRLWDTRTGEPLGPELRDNAYQVNYAVSPDKRKILIGTGDGMGLILDTQTGERIGQPIQHNAGFHAAFTQDSRGILSGSRDETVRYWDATTGEPIGPAIRLPGTVDYIWDSADETKIFTQIGQNKGVYIRDISWIHHPNRLLKTCLTEELPALRYEDLEAYKTRKADAIARLEDYVALPKADYDGPLFEPGDVVDHLPAHYPDVASAYHPIYDYHYAAGLFYSGRKTEAAYWLYSGQYRFQVREACYDMKYFNPEVKAMTDIRGDLGRNIRQWVSGDIDLWTTILDLVDERHGRRADSFAPSPECDSARKETRTEFKALREGIEANADKIRALRLENGRENRN